jgi:hypothetical protein
VTLQGAAVRGPPPLLEPPSLDTPPSLPAPPLLLDDVPPLLDDVPPLLSPFPPLLLPLPLPPEAPPPLPLELPPPLDPLEGGVFSSADRRHPGPKAESAMTHGKAQARRVRDSFFIVAPMSTLRATWRARKTPDCVQLPASLRHGRPAEWRRECVGADAPASDANGSIGAGARRYP